MEKRLTSVLIVNGASEERAELRKRFMSDNSARYSVIEAETGARAIELYRERSPDWVILDQDLPDRSGLDVLKQLSAGEGTLDCEVVLLAGARATPLADEAAPSDANDRLEKNRARVEKLRRVASYAIKEAARQKIGVVHDYRTTGVPPPKTTELKLAGEQLRLLKTAIEQSTESVIITTAQLDPPGPQIVYVNPAFTKMTGYAPEDVIGKTPRILQGPKTDRAMLDRLRKDCEEGRVFFGETVNYRKDGSEFYLEWSVGPVRNEHGVVTHFIATQREVSERRRVEEELRRSEEEFRSLFDLSAIGMTQVSPGGRYLRVNRKLCQMLGYTEQEMLQLTLHEVTHPDDREVSANILSSSFDNAPDEFSIEKRYVRKDGSIIWVLIHWEVISDSQGRPMHTVANIQDITARKRAEEALRANEAQLRAILDNSTAFIFVKDIEGRYLRINRWYEIMKGMKEAEVKGKTDYDLYAREVADSVRANDREVLASKAAIQFEEQVPFADGVHHFIAVKFPLYGASGEPYAVCGIATDITERKRAEEALRASEERFRSLVEQASDGIFIANLDGTYTDVNKSACQMLGYMREELIGKRISDLISPEDIPRLDVVRASLLVGEVHVGEWRLKRKDGDYLPVEISAKIFQDGRWKAIVRDITGRKQADAEREELLAREQKAREIAEAANRSKDEFLAVVSHELRSPLNAMLGYARLLQYGPLDARKVKQVVEIIERNGKAQSQLIDDLLDTARIISGKLKLDVGPVDLIAVIREAAQTIYPAADLKGISLHTDITSEVGQITGDPARLQQVIWNLLSNAVKFTPAGGRVELRLERIDPHVCLTVSDTGEGVSPEFLPFIFDRFRQADASSVRRHGGLGLGLALVKYLVELHGGTIEATSAGEGKGSTFKVLLPVRAVSSPLGKPEGEPVEVPGLDVIPILAGVRALVVDDETDARELVRAVLEQYGAVVLAASSAAEAYDLITSPARESTDAPDVIVADLGMPDEDGFSLLRRVREWERGHNLYTPAVALTAYGRVEDRVRALMAGFQSHVAKPVESAELTAVIANLVRLPQRG
ncbi:MAG TPA: PAS domain S-box protein [Blastocatellia bacterium]|nr:PAS domain S-box protein [Blastocatellia bacterium]